MGWDGVRVSQASWGFAKAALDHEGPGKTVTTCLKSLIIVYFS